MSKLMQSHIVLTDREIPVAVNALKQSIDRYLKDNAEYLALPYQIILSRIQEVQNDSMATQADITLVGGNITCMTYALQLAKLNTEDNAIAETLHDRVTKHTYAINTAYL